MSPKAWARPARPSMAHWPGIVVQPPVTQEQSPVSAPNFNRGGNFPRPYFRVRAEQIVRINICRVYASAALYCLEYEILQLRMICTIMIWQIVFLGIALFQQRSMYHPAVSHQSNGEHIHLVYICVCIIASVWIGCTAMYEWRIVYGSDPVSFPSIHTSISLAIERIETIRDQISCRR
jgi:hypothetical protein